MKTLWRSGFLGLVKEFTRIWETILISVIAGFQSGVLTVYGNCNNIDCDPQVEVLPLKSSPSCQINGIDGLERNGGFGGTIGDDHKPVYCCGYYPDMKSALADCYIFQGMECKTRQD